MIAAISKPYADVLPPLSCEEFDALEISVKEEGVRHPVLITEDGRVLDGHHRLKIDPDAPMTVVPGSAGWSDAECIAYVIRCNWQRRNLSPSQKGSLIKTMQEVALSLRQQDDKKFTQKVIAAMFGVTQQAISAWFTTNTNGCISCEIDRPDARVKIPAKEKAKIFDRCEVDDENQQQVAADYGVTRQAVSKICAAELKRVTREAENKRLAAEWESDDREIVYAGDFRDVANDHLPDESVGLIFTDPPYHRKHLHLYEGVAEVGKRVLREGGSLLCYASHLLIPDIVRLAAKHLDYHWCCACIHSGPLARMREYGIQVGWKPILWFVKGRRVPEDRHRFVLDCVLSTGREKGHHAWQQAEADAEAFIASLTAEGELVFDPFCGGGTTAIAAVRLGRRVVTCDLDRAACARARERLLATTTQRPDEVTDTDSSTPGRES